MALERCVQRPRLGWSKANPKVEVGFFFPHSSVKAMTVEGQSRAAQYLWGLGKKHYFHFEREARVGSGEHN